MELFTPEQIAQMFNVPVQNVKDHLKENGKQLRSMEAKAKSTGKKVNGYTANQLNTLAKNYE